LSDRGIPVASTILSFAIGIIVFLPFPGWQKLVGFITAASNLAYATGAVAVASLRRQDPERERPFRLPLVWLVAPAGFIVANLIIYWSGWTTVWRLMVALGIGFVVFVVSRPFTGEEGEQQSLDLRGAMWLPPYLVGLSVISYLGRYDGRNLIPFWIDLIVLAVFSLAIFWLALQLRIPDEQAKRYVENLDPMVEDAA
jgi:amino acid transporter